MTNTARSVSVAVTLVLAAGGAAGGCDFSSTGGSGQMLDGPASPDGSLGAGADAASPGSGGDGGAVPASDAPGTGMDGASGQPEASGGSPEAGAAPPDAAAPGPDAASPDTGVSAFPPGPYGLKVNDIMGDLSFTREDGRRITFGELRADPKTKVILWSSGAEWCTVCRGEVPTLKQIHASKATRGVVILSSLHQSQNTSPADAQTLKRWDNMFQVPYLLAVEKSPPYNAPQDRNPVVSVIDAETMKIWSREVYGTTGLDATVEAALKASTRP